MCFNLRFESEDELAVIAAGMAGDPIVAAGTPGVLDAQPAPATPLPTAR